MFNIFCGLISALIAAGLVLAYRVIRYTQLTNPFLKDGYFQRTRLLVQGTAVYGILISMLQPDVWRALQKRNNEAKEAREEYFRKMDARKESEVAAKTEASSVSS